MAQAQYKPYVAGELSDEVINKSPEVREIRMGNCRVTYTPSTKTFSFTTSGDDEWPLESLDNFRVILDYIELAYGR